MTRGEKAAEALSKGDAIDDEEAAFADFFNQVSQAEATAEADAVAAVRAADKGWQAHMTYLERRFSSQWRQQSGTRYVDSENPPSLEDTLARIDQEDEEQRARGAA
jgi:hypothetical protein